MTPLVTSSGNSTLTLTGSNQVINGSVINLGPGSRIVATAPTVVFDNFAPGSTSTIATPIAGDNVAINTPNDDQQRHRLGMGVAGAIVLSASNTYTGTTTVSGGTLRLGSLRHSRQQPAGDGLLQQHAPAGRHGGLCPQRAGLAGSAAPATA